MTISNLGFIVFSICAILVLIRLLAPLRNSVPRVGISTYELIPEGFTEISLEQATTGVSAAIEALNKKSRFAIHHIWDSTTRTHKIYISAWGRGAEEFVQRAASVASCRAIKSDSPLPQVSHITKIRREIWASGGGESLVTKANDLSNAIGEEFSKMNNDAYLSIVGGVMGGYSGRKYAKWLRDTAAVVDKNLSAHHPHFTRILIKVSIYAGTTNDDSRGLLTNAVNKIYRYDFRTTYKTVSDLYPLAIGTALGIASIGVGVSHHLEKFTVLGVSVIVLLQALEVGFWARYRLYGQIAQFPYIKAGLRGSGYLSRSFNMLHFRGTIEGMAVQNQTLKPVQYSLYPPTSFIIFAPIQIASFFIPPSRLNSTTASSASLKRPAPPKVISADGVRIGTDSLGYAVRINEADRVGGVMTVGDPGKGKTVACLAIWGGDLIIRRLGSRTSLDNFSERTMIWFETKGEGAQRAYQIALQAGYEDRDILRLDIADPYGVRLNLTPGEDTKRNAEELVDAISYALEEGSIMEHSRQILIAAFTLAMCVTDEMVDDRFGGKRPSLLDVVCILMGAETRRSSNRTLTPQEELFDIFTIEARKPDAPQALVEATDIWDYWMSQSQRVRDDAMKSPLNKILGLQAVRSIWTASYDRPETSLQQILQNKQVVIINFGSGQISETVAKRFAAMTLHLLWQAIKKECDDWGQLKQYVTIYADEVSDISGTGSSDDIIAEMRDAGRSRGVRLVLATQRYNQLPSKTINAVTTFSTKISLATENYSEAERIVNDIVGNSTSSYSIEDIRSLRIGEAIIRTRVNEEVQPPFSIQIEKEDAISVAKYFETRPSDLERA